MELHKTTLCVKIIVLFIDALNGRHETYHRLDATRCCSVLLLSFGSLAVGLEPRQVESGNEAVAFGVDDPELKGNRGVLSGRGCDRLHESRLEGFVQGVLVNLLLVRVSYGKLFISGFRLALLGFLVEKPGQLDEDFPLDGFGDALAKSETGGHFVSVGLLCSVRMTNVEWNEIGKSSSLYS